jgi:hypothetical protein
MECAYCKAILQTAYSLKQHQKTAKYCLSKQNKDILHEHLCGACGKGFTRKSSLEDHLKICKENIPSVNQLQQILDEKNTDIFALKKDLDIALQTIEELRKEVEDYKEKMFLLASKTTHKTINKTQNLLVSDWRPEVINEKVQDNFKLEHVEEGLVGVAKFTSQYITNSDGECKTYHCTDRNREVFMYKDVDGVIQKDIQARKLKNAIKDPIIKKSSILVLEERTRLSDIIVKANDYDSDIVSLSSYKINKLTDKFIEIKAIDDNDQFTKEMAILST